MSYILALVAITGGALVCILAMAIVTTSSEPWFTRVLAGWTVIIGLLIITLGFWAVTL